VKAPGILSFDDRFHGTGFIIVVVQNFSGIPDNCEPKRMFIAGEIHN